MERIEEYSFLRREHTLREKARQMEFDFPGVICPSPLMQSVYEALLRAAESTSARFD